jgi:NAD(P)-dependent dehydrogenase (short-subunit alcohol dehydrogenase family)
MKRFDGKVAIVTGASGGLGRAVAIIFAKEGAKVALCSRRISEGQETAQMIRDIGGEALYVQCDIAKSDQVIEFVKETIDTFGSLDCAVNNAGIIGKTVSLLDYPEDDWDDVVNVNLKGTWFCMKYEIPEMLKQGKGGIVNVSSVVGLVGDISGVAPYTATKHGIVGLTKSAALEFATRGVRINTICPGFIDTDMLKPIFDAADDKEATRNILEEEQAMNRIARPEEIAHAAVWLCSDEASYITGAAIPVDGGCTTR